MCFCALTMSFKDGRRDEATKKTGMVDTMPATGAGGEPWWLVCHPGGD